MHVPTVPTVAHSIPELAKTTTNTPQNKLHIIVCDYNCKYCFLIQCSNSLTHNTTIRIFLLLLQPATSSPCLRTTKIVLLLSVPQCHCLFLPVILRSHRSQLFLLWRSSQEEFLWSSIIRLSHYVAKPILSIILIRVPLKSPSTPLCLRSHLSSGNAPNSKMVHFNHYNLRLPLVYTFLQR